MDGQSELAQLLKRGYRIFKIVNREGKFGFLLKRQVNQVPHFKYLFPNK